MQILFQKSLKYISELADHILRKKGEKNYHNPQCTNIGCLHDFVAVSLAVEWSLFTYKNIE